MIGLSADESLRTLHAPTARAAEALRDALRLAGYAAEMRADDVGYAVAYLAFSVARSSILFPSGDGRHNGGA